VYRFRGDTYFGGGWNGLLLTSSLALARRYHRQRRRAQRPDRTGVRARAAGDRRPAEQVTDVSQDRRWSRRVGAALGNPSRRRSGVGARRIGTLDSPRRRGGADDRADPDEGEFAPASRSRSEVARRRRDRVSLWRLERKVAEAEPVDGLRAVRAQLGGRVRR